MIDSSQLTYYSASETRSDRRVVVVKEHIASEMAPGLDSCTCGTLPIKARAMDGERRTMRHQITVAPLSEIYTWKSDRSVVTTWWR